MLNIYKKWVLLAATLLLIGANPLSCVRNLELPAIIGFFVIPSLIWLDEALSKYKPNLTSIFSFIIFAIIFILFSTRYLALVIESDKLFPIALIKPFILTIHVLVIAWALMYILWQKLSPLACLPHTYNIIAYSLGMIYILLSYHAHYQYYLDFILNFIILNSLLIAFYYIFNLHLTQNFLLNLPFYMVLFAIVTTLYVYSFAPEVAVQYYYKLTPYILVLTFITFIILAFASKNPKGESLNSYHNLSFLCIIAFIITCLRRFSLNQDFQLNEDTLFSSFGVEILSIIIIFLFKIMEIHNRTLRFLLIIITTIIISVKTVKNLILLINHYNILKINPNFLNQLYKFTPFVIHNAVLILTGLLIVTYIYRTIFPVTKPLN